jgi:hypothetical protein
MPPTVSTAEAAGYTALALVESKLAAITPTIWKNKTSLFAKPRSTELSVVDQEIENWHTRYASGPGDDAAGFHEELGVRAVVIHYAFEAWKTRDRSDKDPARGPDGWKKSKRNKEGMMTQLNQILHQYTIMTTRYAQAKLPGTEMELTRWQRTQYEEAFVSMFKGARMVAKKSFLREIAAGATVVVAQRTGAADALSAQVTRGTDALQAQAARGAQYVAESSTGQFAAQVGEMVKTQFGRAVDSHVMQVAIHAVGIGEAAFVGFLDHAARAVINFIGNIPGLSLLKDVGTAVTAFYTAISAHIKYLAGRRARYVVRGGSLKNAYDKITDFWADERKEALQDAAKSLAKAVVKGVCLAVTAGAAAIIETVVNAADAVYTALKKVWDMISKVVNVIKEIVEVNEGLATLTVRSEERQSEKLFEISPLLACYYFLCLDTSGLLALDTQFMSLKGYVTVFNTLRKQLEPVQAKAAAFVAEHKFMFVNAAGKPLPVRAVVDKGLLAQIKEAMKEQVGSAIGDAVVTPVTGAVTDAATGYVTGVNANVGALLADDG